MLFDELNGGECKTYLIASERTREAIVVDPVEEHVSAYVDRLRRDGLRLVVAIDTHTHADHLSGARSLAEATGATTAGAPDIAVDCPLHEGDVVTVDDISIEAWATPGHTADSLSLRMADRILTGDVLFVGATGRTDLPSGDTEAEWKSLARLMTLRDAMLVFPAHDYRGNLSSTIGRERAENKRLTGGHEAFLEEMRRVRKPPVRLAESLAWNTRPKPR